MISILSIGLYGIFGVIIGSFLNVAIIRYNTGRSLSGRSACPSCSHPLSWRDLVPIVSFFMLRTRCRYCESAMSWQYPITEGLTALLFIGVALLIPIDSTVIFLTQTAVLLVAMSLLVMIAVYDFRHTIIPDVPVYVLIALSFIQLFLVEGGVAMPSFLALLAGPAVALPLALLWLVSRGKWMGLGDAKLALALGWLLGLPGAFSMLVLSFWLGALVGVLLMLYTRVVHDSQLFGTAGRLTMKSEMAFGPFLIAAYLFVLFFEFDALKLLTL